jgi:hypothetical protein
MIAAVLSCGNGLQTALFSCVGAAANQQYGSPSKGGQGDAADVTASGRLFHWASTKPCIICCQNSAGSQSPCVHISGICFIMPDIVADIMRGMALLATNARMLPTTTPPNPARRSPGARDLGRVCILTSISVLSM